MSKNEFYIGWQEEMPPSNKRFIRRILIGVFLLIPILILYGVLFQKQFNHHHFEFGTITELTGIYHENPVPILEVSDGDTTEFILLVGFGKFGAEKIIFDIETEHGELDGKEVKLDGTLIYGDGVSLLELTNQEDSYVSSKDSEKESSDEVKDLGEFNWYGEILDPKCYFGVMKPGEGKIHKSCAIRCISGGIPPVMRVWSHYGGGYHYYLVKGKNAEKVNEEVLQYVGESIGYSATITQQNGWEILNIDLESIKAQRDFDYDLKDLDEVNRDAYE